MSDFHMRRDALWAEFPKESAYYESEFNEIQAKMEIALKAAANTYDWMKVNADHKYDCPRSRDDYHCTCGLSEVMDDLERVLGVQGTAK